MAVGIITFPGWMRHPVRAWVLLCTLAGAPLCAGAQPLPRPEAPAPDLIPPVTAATDAAPMPVSRPVTPPAEDPAAPPMTPRPVASPILTLPPPRPEPVPRMAPSCTADGQHCIALPTYAADLCRTVQGTAEAAGLDPYFLARLLWQESRFNARALSPAGAQGVAQFIPTTAQLRGLEDPFDPAPAIEAAALYLKDLEQRFGSLGLAAAAYNGGENRLRRYLSGQSGLPSETRAYVARITGRAVDLWIAPDAPPPPLRRFDLPRISAPLGPDFQEACVTLATQGTPPERLIQPDTAPWVVIFAAHPRRDMARRRGAFAYRRHAELFSGTQLTVAEHRLPGSARPFHAAQVGLTSRPAADSLCASLRQVGNGCMVLAN